MIPFQAPRRIAPKNRQLIIMLFVETIIYIVFSLMQPIFLLYSLSTSSVTKTLQQRRLESFVLSNANKLYRFVLEEFKETTPVMSNIEQT
jgi:hypothetical protein